MERQTNKNIIRTLACAVGLGFVAVGCANYSGSGNEFTVKGRVTGTGESSLEVDVYEIDQTSGRANGWFEDGVSHRLHDNCDCHGFWSGRKQYGQVISNEGRLISPSDVTIGSCVEFDGKIRSNQEGKSHDDRPVYDTATEIAC